MTAICMNQRELAVRWGISPRTLERWRWTGEGPNYLKLGGRVAYRLVDIEAYERIIVRTRTSASTLVHEYSPQRDEGAGNCHHVYRKNDP